ncbi:MAG: hypothetical protein IH593_04590 [Bacteroidales bacterium]|nr:hypothetical protein [Bacteroidales bacterium]
MKTDDMLDMSVPPVFVTLNVAAGTVVLPKLVEGGLIHTAATSSSAVELLN